MAVSIAWSLTRAEPWTPEEGAQLAEHVVTWSDALDHVDYAVAVGIRDGQALAEGHATVDEADPDLPILLDALTELAVQVPDAIVAIGDASGRVAYDPGKGRYVLGAARMAMKADKAPRATTKGKKPAAKAAAKPLEPPRYTRVGLDAWLAAVPAHVPLPPGPPASWSCAFHLLGPGVVISKGDRGHDRAVDSDLLRVLLAELGRPTDLSEQEALLLATPIPASTGLGPVLIRMLRDGKFQVRQRAALLLGWLGDRSAVPALLARLDDDDNDARRGAAEALGRLGGEGVVRELARRPWDSDDSVSAARLEAIDRLNGWDEALLLLDRSTGSDFASLTNAIAVAIGDGEPAELAEHVGHGDTDIQRVAARVVAGSPAFARASVEALAAKAGEGGLDEPVAVWIARALAAAGDDALESIVELLGNDGWEPRALAAVALSSAPALAAQAGEELRAKLDDSDDDVRREVGLALLVGGHGDLRAEDAAGLIANPRWGYLERAGAHAGTVPALATVGMLVGSVPPDGRLLSVLVDSRVDATVRGIAAFLLALAEPELVAPLLDRLSRDDARQTPMDLRRYCAGALMLTGTAPGALPAVQRVLLFNTGEVQTRGMGLGAGLSAFALELLTLGAKDGDWPVRIDALRLLHLLGDEVVGGYKPMLEYIARHDPDLDVRVQAASMTARAWRSVGPGDHLAEALVSPHGSGDEAQRVQAFRSLADAEPALGAVLARQYFRGDDRGMARAGAEVLARAGGDVTALVGIGVSRLEDEGWIAREAACDLLGHLPKDALSEGVLDEVAEALRARADGDSDNDVRTAATAALTRLGVALPEKDEDEDEEEEEDEEEGEEEEEEDEA
jgi:HEAT repeat protein